MLRSRHKFLTILLVLILTVGIFSPLKSVMAADSQTLSWGSTGSAVSQVQQILNNKGYWCGSVDGIFGAKTYNGVVRFQKDVGLPAYGIVGPATQKYLGISTKTVSRGGSINPGRTITMIATGYDAGYKSNYPWYGYPSFIGLPLARGIAATDPNVIPMKTKLYVEGYGEALAADQGNAIKGNRIDLFFDSLQEALNWGIRAVKVTVY
ncbi:MAG TPA: 3D domain-containing protein [Syntrophomonadaceae bacterium]|nr:3D domain-containing protein [Syntrophomonadaceae bacterium]